MALKNKFISLKDAAGISGYAPDYIGQLIRQGKIEGKQQYFNVAWFTTEESLRRYMDKSRKSGSAGVFFNKLFLKQNLFKVIKIVYFIILFFLIIFWLMLLYMIFTGIDNHMKQDLISRSAAMFNELSANYDSK